MQSFGPALFSLAAIFGPWLPTFAISRSGKKPSPLPPMSSAARQHARRETKVVTDQLMLTALNAAGLIADGHGRYTAPEQRHVYRAARRELVRLETQLAIARQADLLAAPTHAQLSTRIQSVSRLVGGYLVFLERQLAAESDKNMTA
jgi:four helix bundle protein